MKTCRKILLLFLVFSLFSCASKSLIPGESKVILENLSAEYFNIAEEYMAQKKYSKAIENYKLSLRTGENTRQINYQLGKALALNKNFQEAEKIFSDLAEEDPDNLILAQSLAYCYAKSGETEKACELYRAVYEKNPYLEDVANNYVLLLLEGGSKEEAEKIFEKFKADFTDSKLIPELEKKLYPPPPEEKTESGENENPGKKDETSDKISKNGEKIPEDKDASLEAEEKNRGDAPDAGKSGKTEKTSDKTSDSDKIVKNTEKKN